MRFHVIPNNSHVPSEGASIGYLWTDNWNDWFEYSTLYSATFFDADGEKHEIGAVKIGQFDMGKKQARPELPDVFNELDERFFSLGQDADYYTAVMSLGKKTAAEFLAALNDISADKELYIQALEENVTGVSLLRSVNRKTIEGQFRRIIGGGVELTDYNFSYVGPTPLHESVESIRLDFEVTPESLPPTNIHVLIGRNGVGKTYLLNAMTRALVSPDSSQDVNGQFISQLSTFEETHESPFSNILSISFSAFDDFKILRQRRNATEGVRYTNVGLRKRIKDNKNEWIMTTRDPEELAKNFSASAKLCTSGVRAERWRKALTTLEADPLFAEAEVASLADVDKEDFGRASGKLYRRLSSGHKIVLLTITKLVEHVEEKTLVLMDEPEAHLHPPLLAAFIRALSDLLINRNGVAIIATHSPVVLQEVPRSCVWKIVRHGHAAEASRPGIETFAENVGLLTSEIFGLEVTRSGFHRLLADSVDDEQQIREVTEKFENQVGAEGRALISSMIASRNAGEGE
ncbi:MULTISPECIES: ATP-dependent nuclease [Pseudomonadota]|uniref:ATP-dependent nuclease n=1 Tax=Pseudomonadota TaxID=1224 RepID=UPI003A902B58